ncbi:MAG: hypothetical protein U0T02_00805 [Solirubrobacteraceae bacterium]
MILAVGSLGGGSIDIVVGALLVVLLAQREILRASGSPRLQARMRTTGMAIPALTIAFVVIVAARLATLVA